MKLKRKQIGILLIAGALIYFWWLKRQEKVDGIEDDGGSTRPAPFYIDHYSPTGTYFGREVVERMPDPSVSNGPPIRKPIGA